MDEEIFEIAKDNDLSLEEILGSATIYDKILLCQE